MSRSVYVSDGQPLAAHLAWLHAQALSPANADIWLPHDGSTHDRIFDVSYESALRQAGFAVEMIPNQGRGAAMARIESAIKTCRSGSSRARDGPLVSHQLLSISTESTQRYRCTRRIAFGLMCPVCENSFRGNAKHGLRRRGRAMAV